MSEVPDDAFDEEELLEESELDSLDVEDTDTSRLRFRELELGFGACFNFLGACKSPAARIISREFVWLRNLHTSILSFAFTS